MKINFNNVRKQAMFSYDRLCERLNSHIRKEGQETLWLDDFGRIEKGTIVIDAESLQNEMENLRSLIGSIACTFEPENEDFKDVYEEAYPLSQDKRMVCFNEPPEEDEG